MAGSSDLSTISTKQERIAELARQMPDKTLYSLSHHIDLKWLHEAYSRTRKDGATGIDGQTAEAYAEELDANLRDLHERAKSGRYRAPAVRRTYIPKADGRKRPLGIPTFEDKVLQRAVAMALEPIYEEDFLDCSYGFRPGRSAHDALEALWQGLMRMGGGVVLDVDIQGFFDNLDHGHLRSFLRQRVTDGVLTRLIGKWLKAGVLEEGQIHRSDAGTPQGGVISPLLANIYLHEVLDKWFENEVQPRLRGKGFLIRYADDFVIVLQYDEDVERVMEALRRRLERFGLSLHPDKTRVVRFRRPPRDGGPRGGTFDLLGFTHYWGRSRKGNWVVKRKTAKKRQARALMAINQWCRRYRHMPVSWQHRLLRWKLQGHYAYYGITHNYPSLARFLRQVQRIWRKWLNRRSQGRHMPWSRYKRLLARYPLPTPTIRHSTT